MKQFAIYFIPSDVYLNKKGSELIGYDILNGRKVKNSKDEQIALAQKLNSGSSQYGFHMTLTDVVEIDDRLLVNAYKRAKFIVSLPIFNDIKIKKEKLSIMPNANVLAIQYMKNIRLMLLHILLVIFVQRMGNNSGYLKQVNNLDNWKKIKTKLFLSPYIFDDFLPHFSLVQNYAHKNHQHLRGQLETLFKDCNDADLKKIAFVVKEPSEENFKVLGYL